MKSGDTKAALKAALAKVANVRALLGELRNDVASPSFILAI